MISLFLANIAGFIVAHKGIFVVVGFVLLLLLIVIGFRSCGRSQSVKIDEETIQKVNSQNERERKKELEKIITENSEVVKTVDERTTIAETNTVERERMLDAKIAEVNQKIAEAKTQGKDVSSAELECLLVPENCK
jgi:hypothetical protein